MISPAIATLTIALVAVILFVTEWLSVDLIAMLLVVALVVTGVISPQEGLAGFSNEATLTVAFMFVLSAALLKTGALQQVAGKMAGRFRRQPKKAMLFLVLVVAICSAFINNTPVVAVFIPVVNRIAATAKIKASKLLIPLSFASIFGGLCTLIGTSTNILVSGIAQDHGHVGFSMFTLAPVGLILLVIGALYLTYFGSRLLPDRDSDDSLADKFAMHDYLAEIVILDHPDLAGKRIMDSSLVRELDMDIIEIRREDQMFVLPPGDFRLVAGDTLKVRCDRKKILNLKDWVRLVDNSGSVRVMGTGLERDNSSLVEMVVTPNSEFVGKNLREVDFRRSYRAVPLAIRQREETLHEQLYNLPLTPGDVILAEVKSHYLAELQHIEQRQDSPFILLSSDSITDFNRGRFLFVSGLILTVIALATSGLLPISIAALLGVCVLVLGRTVTMSEAYESIDWKIVFLLAGALSLGRAMSNSGLDSDIAALLTGSIYAWGPFALVAGMYLATNLLTEMMSNNATAALLAPVALACAEQIGIDPMPLLVTVAIAASASFMTPVGYQTNAMVYSAGRYKFLDFTRFGAPLSLTFWVVTSLAVPLLFGMV
ncbi:di/tricarboxylate transporter [Lewinella aquimaris]|uniref:Di/tricarboxylate transporter n=1 Tax=Neolewinella aquimaris TaxID=1835722 RepID=A0A840EBA9_9BACT|nr:SLC13 family permease [Neolewinella aquimaris]MBB4079079.1 di/tricarboxylate transporter [Neolewinella aquimaris]